MKAKAAFTVSTASIRTIELKRKKLEFSDELSSESSDSDIHGEGNYSGSDVQSDQDSDHVQELRDASNFSEKEIRCLLKSFFEANLSEAEVYSKKLKAYREQQHIEF